MFHTIVSDLLCVGLQRLDIHDRIAAFAAQVAMQPYSDSARACDLIQSNLFTADLEPPPDRLVGCVNTVVGQQFLDIPKGECEPGIEPISHGG